MDLALTSHLEAGFVNGVKTDALFVDLTAVYDTVWHTGLIYKLMNAVRCMRIVTVIDKMLCKKSFRVFVNNDVSKAKSPKNGLAQGSLLDPKLYTIFQKHKR